MSKLDRAVKYKYVSSVVPPKVETDLDKLEVQIKEDQNIDLEKIKKYFENVLNERHFLSNYGGDRDFEDADH